MNGTINLTYDVRGNLTSFGDTTGITRFEYDRSGNLIRQIDAAGNETRFTYDANGNQLTQTQSMTTSNGVRTLVTKTEYSKERDS